MRQSVDPVEVRYRIGMVFQKPNPFPKSIYENIAWTARIHGYKGNMNELVENSLRQAALWDEVKDKLHQSGLSLSGGSSSACVLPARSRIKPEVILMDEPASALDPIATLKIEELMQELKKELHDRHRDAQHAAGCPRFGLYCHDDALAGRRTFRHRHRIR